MIELTARWTFRAPPTMTRHYGHARLLPGHVLGMWFLLDRDSGAPLWQRTFDRPNHLVGVSDQTIIASETVQVGCGWANQGCFAISLATGELTWTSHGDDATDRPTALVGDEVVCDSGRVLALQAILQLGELSFGGLTGERRAQRVGGLCVLRAFVDLVALLFEAPDVEHLAARQYPFRLEQLEQRLAQ